MVDLIAIESMQRKRKYQMYPPLCLKAFLFSRTNFFTGLFIALATAISALPTTANAQVGLLFGDLTWSRINAYLDKEYPEVANVSTKELAANHLTKLAGITLLDTRNADEFSASHLPNAKHYESFKSSLGALAKNSPIVVYCSVGIRSAAIAKKLQAEGFTNVKNLRGSTFMWANEGLPLEGPSAPLVHPYNARWGALLNAPLRLKI
jgi:rhodanese-related sulfurtransferase